MYVYITRNDPPGNNALRCHGTMEGGGGGGGRGTSFLEEFPSCRDASRKRCNAPIDNMPTRRPSFPLLLLPSSLHRHLPRSLPFSTDATTDPHSSLFVHIHCQSYGEDQEDISVAKKQSMNCVYIYI